MQNKGLIRTLAIIFGLICLYYLSFTWVNNTIENDAKQFAGGNAEKEQVYLDSVANLPIANYLYTKYTYNEVRDKAINLGLDLKGGIDATLEIAVRDILIGLSNESKNPVFNKALADASEAEKSSDEDYLTLFFEAFDKASNGTVRLNDPSIFRTKSLVDKGITNDATDSEVKAILRDEIKGSISTAFEVLRSRIDRFGVTSPSIQQIGESGRISIQLPGAKDIDRVTKLLTGTAKLQFWEVFENTETAQFLIQANTKLAEVLKTETTTTEVAKDTTATKDDDLGDILDDNTAKDSIDAKVANPLFSILSPNIPQNAQQKSAIIGLASLKDTATINKYLAMKEVRSLLPNNMMFAKFLWAAKSNENSELINLYVVKSNRKDTAPVQGDVIDDAAQSFSDANASMPIVNMQMNSKGTKLWGKLTTENVGKPVAIVLDNYVYSAPYVEEAMTMGSSRITGNFTIAEAQDLANALKSGKLPAKARIIESSVVGASLGHESINNSMMAFIIALSLVLVWMIFYYGKAGIFADIALVANILFIFGVLTAFGAVLTLPGVAGVIITIGMAVDANVIIYERIKEALANGKVLKDAIAEGFSLKGALSAIIDANVTTFLTGIILYIFGSGPIKGFATTLMIGIATSLVSAVFITRLLIDWYANKDYSMTFNTSITKGWFQKLNVEFLQKRKIAYVISGIIILVGLGSIFTQGFNQGVDFKGGRTYTVRFDQGVSADEVRSSLKDVFGDAPEVKTYGGANQLKITTDYKVEESSIEVSEEIQTMLFKGVQSFLPDGTTFENFKVGTDDNPEKIGIMKYFEVGPTIADDIKQKAVWAILGSLIVVFLYILLRFRKWQYSLGAVAAVFHDVLIVLAVFSLFWKVLPFDMEIGQSFIAAILTVVGYSLNDTVVIFDRIREFAGKHPSWPFADTVNRALSTTLGRTINTSLTTLIVLLSIFIFGGDSIKGFMFAMIIGVIVGTYSSLFIASPIMYDTMTKVSKKK